MQTYYNMTKERIVPRIIFSYNKMLTTIFTLDHELSIEIRKNNKHEKNSTKKYRKYQDHHCVVICSCFVGILPSVGL